MAALPAPATLTTSPDQGDVVAQALTIVGGSTARVVQRVEDIKHFTEREVLGCGEQLATLVDTVRGLIADSDRSVAASRARSAEINARFVAGMQADMEAQHDAVQNVLTLADGIQAATTAIERLTQLSHILAMNMRIEAAHAGEHGRGFAVIADQMKEMAGTIRTSAEQVTTAVAGVRAGLPTVLARAMAMQERTRQFIAEVEAEVEGSSPDGLGGPGQHAGLDAVMQLSNAALSHLQFHDPLVKQLDAILRDVTRSEERLHRAVNGLTDDHDDAAEDAGTHAVHDPDGHAPAALGATPAPGGLMLF